ncbi:MAG: RecBCD nuclease inhibitor [Candidatus Competibacteraceae bacterium]|nr:RecBCD nuclease inhibitor [Candidatus Competibacteraceae bacterium]
MPNSPTITITVEEFISFTKDSKMLRALEYIGVDNWDGYHEAYLIAHADGVDDDEVDDNA